MIYSDEDLTRLLYYEGRIGIDPRPGSDAFGPCNIDFRLGNEFAITTLDGEPLMAEIADDKAFALKPGDFVLATTKERLRLPNDIAARLEGKSSIARQGVIVHSTAGLFHPGWDGVPVLELANLSRRTVYLTPGMAICSFTFEALSSPARFPYGGRYVSQKGIQV